VATIHPTAIVDRKAELAADVSIGPFCVIEGNVQLADGVVVHSHCVIQGTTLIGAGCQIGPGAYVGLPPQHLHFDSGIETFLILGEKNIIREGAQLHRATKPGIENATRVGDRCMLMACSHVAHDCKVGNDVLFANTVALGGFVEVGDRVFLGGGAKVHQFCRVGRLAIIGGGEAATTEVPPFGAMRYYGLKGYNAVGCRRAGMSRESLSAIRAAYHCIHAHRTMNRSVAAIKESVPQVPEVRELLEFIATSKRGIVPSVRWLASSVFGSDKED
jgi:UDP-N-acetylglucosamine acyltransferase